MSSAGPVASAAPTSLYGDLVLVAIQAGQVAVFARDAAIQKTEREVNSDNRSNSRTKVQRAGLEPWFRRDWNPGKGGEEGKGIAIVRVALFNAGRLKRPHLLRKRPRTTEPGVEFIDSVDRKKDGSAVCANHRRVRIHAPESLQLK